MQPSTAYDGRAGRPPDPACEALRHADMRRGQVGKRWVKTGSARTFDASVPPFASDQPLQRMPQSQGGSSLRGLPRGAVADTVGLAMLDPPNSYGDRVN